MMRSLYLAFLVTLACLLAPAPAGAESKPIQVLTVMSADAFDNAAALTTALKRAVTRADGWSLAPGEYSLEVLMAGFNCDEQPDADCLTQIAGSIGENRFIWGTMEVVDDQVVTQLHLWEDGKNIGRTRLKYSANLLDSADDTLLGMAEDAFHELLGVAEGELVVLAGDVTGEVFVNGQSVGRIEDGTADFRVPAGELEVILKAPGYLDARGKATLRPGDSTRVVLDVLPDPDYSDSKGKKPRSRRDGRERGSVSAQKAVGIGAVGAGVIVAGVGMGYWVSSYGQRSDDAYEEYRTTVDRDADPCDQAKIDQRQDIVDHCEANRSTRTMARILTPAGGVVAIAGLVLVLTDKPASQSARRRVQPALAVGPRGGQLDLTVRF